MTYVLSICIPTYNRAEMLRAAVESILLQNVGNVEIVVSDNASTDGTDTLMHALSQRHPQIKYVRSEVNVGADRNFLKVVELASGTYAWLLGSDDMVAPGGVAEILKTIENCPGLPGFSVNRQMYDISMSRRITDMDIFPSHAAPIHVHKSAQTAISELGIYLSYISGQVFKTSAWHQYVRAKGIEQYFNGLVHLYPLMALIRDANTWGAMSSPIIHCRSDNDSFLSAGHFKRFEIDVIGYSRIAGDVFGTSTPIYQKLMGDVLRSLLVNRVIGFKLVKVRGIYFKSFLSALPVFWQKSRFWLVFVPALLMPAALMQRALELRRRIKTNTELV